MAGARPMATERPSPLPVDDVDICAPQRRTGSYEEALHNEKPSGLDAHTNTMSRESDDVENDLGGAEMSKTSSETVIDRKATDEFPEGGYGWVVVAAQTTICAMTWGVNASFAVYLSHYTAPGSTYFPGTTTTQYTFVGGISVCIALVVSPVASLLSHLYGHRVPMYLGCIVEGAGFIGASFSTKFYQLFITQGLLFGIGLGLLFAPSVQIPAFWFSKRRALANGICAGGSGIGGIIFNVGTDAMIQNLSLAWAFRITGIIVLVVNFIATTLIRTPPGKSMKSNGSRDVRTLLRSMIDPSVCRHAGYMWILLWGLCSLFGYVTVQFTITKEAVNYLHMTQKQGSTLAALLSAGMTFGRPALGYFGDRIGRINAAILATFATALTCLLWWMFARSFAAMAAFAVINGAIVGTFWTSVIPVTAEIVGLQDLNAAATIVWLTMSIPTVFATTVALRIVGESGDYLRLIGFAGGMFLAASVALVPSKMRRQQRDGVPALRIWHVA